MSTLTIAVPATVLVFLALRLVVRHDRAVSRLMLSVIAVVGNGPRARRAARLLSMYLKSTD